MTDKHCPFCGSTPERDTQYIRCSNRACPCSKLFKPEVWNTRYPEPPPKQSPRCRWYKGSYEKADPRLGPDSPPARCERQEGHTGPHYHMGKPMLMKNVIPDEQPQKPDENRLHSGTSTLVDNFADALKEKLLKAQQKYGYTDQWARYGWEIECRNKLYEHLQKGDPLDVANYCMFMWIHRWSTSQHPTKGAINALRKQDKYDFVTVLIQCADGEETLNDNPTTAALLREAATRLSNIRRQTKALVFRDTNPEGQYVAQAQQQLKGEMRGENTEVRALCPNGHSTLTSMGNWFYCETCGWEGE